MGTLCGWASTNENGKKTGGKKGDQTGREVKTGSWYNFGQTVVLRFKDRNKAAKAATAMKQLCNNDAVGYCQGHRTSLYTELEKVGWKPTALKTPCETDCSAMMPPVLKCAGISVPKDIYTGNMVNAIMATGEFEKLTGSKYTSTGDNLMTGDIMVAAGKHTIMALENGRNVSTGNTAGSTSSCSGTAGKNPAVPYGTAKTATFMGYVNTSVLNVRKKPDPAAEKLTAYPQIKKNTEVGVCGSAKAPDGAMWYYICIDGTKGKKYGYVNASYITAK